MLVALVNKFFCVYGMENGQRIVPRDHVEIVQRDGVGVVARLWLRVMDRMMGLGLHGAVGLVTTHSAIDSSSSISAVIK